MNMFSMKPKFNLAEFLAEPPKPGAGRKQTRGMQYHSPAKAKDEKKTVQTEAPKDA